MTRVHFGESPIRCRMLAALAGTLLLVSAAQAQDAMKATGGEDDATKLAKETQNPVANLISVPFQNNFNFGAGSKDKMVWILNVQPVIPDLDRPTTGT